MIYISSSWKNREQVREIANLLRTHGFGVYDFTDPSCRKTPEIPPEKFPKQFDPELHVYRYYLDRPEWRSAVEENRAALDRCKGVILLLPCGVDATADWAYAMGLGKPSVVVGHPRAGDRSPVHLWADAMVETAEEAVQWLIDSAPFHVGDLVQVSCPDNGDTHRWRGEVEQVDFAHDLAFVQEKWVSFSTMRVLERGKLP